MFKIEIFSNMHTENPGCANMSLGEKNKLEGWHKQKENFIGEVLPLIAFIAVYMAGQVIVN